MTGFERASIALIYNLYYAREAHSKDPIKKKYFLVETYDEDNKFRRKRYFHVREVSSSKIDVALDEGNRYRIFNDQPLVKHSTVIYTEERPTEKVEVESLNGTLVNGLGGGHRFTIEHYAYDQVRIRDEETRKSYIYKISQ